MPHLIETARLRMRPFELCDTDEMHRLWTDPAVRKFLWDDIVITRDRAAQVVRESLALFAEKGFGFWVVSQKEDDAAIGFCGLREYGKPLEAELLYGFYSAYWGQGFATEAAAAILHRGFEMNRLQRIWAGADPPNKASVRVMERIGMRYNDSRMVGGLEAIYYVIERLHRL
jgi:ribosomal-protein-alanine N-acetyltransferase